MVNISKEDFELLSGREKEVLQWLCIGKTNWEIGKLMSISEYTVKNHISKILEKLNVSNRHHAVAKGIEMGLIVFVS